MFVLIPISESCPALERASVNVMPGLPGISPLLVMRQMIEERRQDVREHLENAYHKQSRDHPLPYLLRQRRLHDLPEAQADGRDGRRDNDRGPNHKAFAVSADVHGNVNG